MLNEYEWLDSNDRLPKEDPGDANLAAWVVAAVSLIALILAF